MVREGVKMFLLKLTKTPVFGLKISNRERGWK